MTRESYAEAKRRYYIKQKRKQAKRRNAVFMTFTIIVFCAGILCGSLMLHAQSAQAQSAHNDGRVCYQSVQVQSGDTLWSISENYSEAGYSSRGAYIQEIRSMNHISDNNIQRGSYIMVPCISQEK